MLGFCITNGSICSLLHDVSLSVSQSEKVLQVQSSATETKGIFFLLVFSGPWIAPFDSG